ncbi:cytochrome p450 [Lichtheimia corymbifera JMRC:FSU:9682]|uniref:Cytochrome p450 n=1 Tax=Lichtheimia corymbifera JMRC:FSU:9682 TaxID=1263082 RepID=A0A068RZP0_9FUNG|nr:cytochrome p450 [Lichtheimia corymbifera JMRC:FSU:9682]
MIVAAPSWNSLTTWHPAKAGALTAAASFVALAAILYRQLSSSNKDQGDSIPSPEGSLPFIGHLWKLRKGAVKKCLQWQDELGPIYRLNLGMGKKWVIIGSPTVAHEILVANGSMTAVRPYQRPIHDILTLGGKGVAFASPSKGWRMMRSAFNPKNLEKYSTLLDKDADDLIGYFLSHNGGNVNPELALMRTALNFVLITCFAINLGTLDDPLFRRISISVEEAASFVGVSKEARTFLPILGNKFQERFKDYINNRHHPLLREMMAQSMDTGKECLVRTYHELRDEGIIDDDDIVVAMTEIMTAGSDTTVATMLWQLLILAKYPEVQAKMQAEVDEFVKKHDRLPTFAEREATPYIIATQKECIRFRPTSYFGLPHAADRDIVWRGNIIEKGTTIVGNMRALHTSTELFEDPEEFKPERFLGRPALTMFSEANGNVQDRTNFIFGFGRRTCPGIHLAELQMYNIFVRLFQKCTIMPGLDDNGQPIPIDLESLSSRSFVSPPAPYQVRFVPRV